MAGGIICGVDDSESARGAVRVARALSAPLGLDVVFVRVVEPGAPDANAGGAAQRREGLDGGADDAEWLVAAGHPADGLLAAARMAGASMIVVGSTGPRSSLLGSVSADLSRRAPCPVVVVPPGADARVDGPAGERRESAKSPGFRGAVARVVSAEHRAELAGGLARLDFGSRRRDASDPSGGVSEQRRAER